MDIKSDYLSFINLFSGNKSVYGVHKYDGSVTAGEKRVGKSFTKREPLTDGKYLDHLRGTQGLGVVPVNEKNKCKFAVIDIDEYKRSFDVYIKLSEEYCLPLCFFRSKSGGLHSYVFFNEEYPAQDVITQMKSIVTLLGLNQKTEIFPKQSRLTDQAGGNWINLPYFNSDNNTCQFLYGSDMQPLTLSDAIKQIDPKIVSVDELKDVLLSLPLSDAPPCIQTLYLLNDFTKESGNRNTFLFNLATYYKNKYGDEFPQYLHEANLRLPEPLDKKELEETVIKSQKRKTYNYQFNLPLLAQFRNTEECKKRKYGDAPESPDVSYGVMKKFRGFSTRYEWEVNNKILKFNNEQEVLSQESFLALCMRELDVYPRRLSRDRWDQVIRDSVKNMVTEKDHDEFSSEVVFLDYLTKFLTSGAKAQNKEHLRVGRVYVDETTEEYVFRRTDLIQFLDEKRFNKLKLKNIKEILLKIGGHEKRYSISHGSTIKVWMIPKNQNFDIYDLDSKKDEEFLVDFSNIEEKKDEVEF